MSLKLLSHSPVWTGAGWTMVHLVWLGAVIGVLAALSRRLMRRTGPEIRHAAALFWLFVLAGSPAAIFVCVFQPVVVDAEPTISRVERSAEATVVIEADLAPTVAMLAGNGAQVKAEAIEAAHWQLESVVPYLPAVWLAGSLCALMLLLTGLIGVSGLRRSSQLITGGELPRRLCALADSLGIVRQVSIGVCDRLNVPVLIGVIRPLILLPPAALCGWSTDQLEMVLLHELAHLRRWDNVINIFQRMVESLLFFHPVVWWVSEWLCLERESCCDRLVVGRRGQPVAYAEVLLELAGSRDRKRAVVLAMADRMVMTRIRRLFKVEDQSMKLTVPEGIGLLGAAIVGTLLVFAAQAAQQEPRNESPELVRQALEAAKEAVAALPRQGMEHDFTVDTLANIARAQMKLGARGAALATLKIAYDSIDRVDAKKSDFAFLGSLTQVARQQRELGDVAAARVTVNRIVKVVESLEAKPFVEEIVQVTGSKEPIRRKLEINAMIRCELLLMNAEEQLAVGDRDAALTSCRRALKVIETQQGMLKPMALAYIAISFHKAGDHKGAGTVIGHARQLAGELPEHREKEAALAEITRALAETGDIEGALQLASSLDKHGIPNAIEKIVASFTEDKPGEAWLPVSGIKITIGAPSRRIQQRDAARIALPKLVKAAIAIDDRLIQAQHAVDACSLASHGGEV